MLPKQACMGLRKAVFIIVKFNNMKSKTEHNDLPNSSQSTASSESILPKKVPEIPA